jgi:hypothetical protein
MMSLISSSDAFKGNGNVTADFMQADVLSPIFSGSKLLKNLKFTTFRP